MKYISFKDIQKKKQISPATVLIAGFLLLIFLGSVLLYLPVSNRFGSMHPKYYLDCLFTAVSCVCVTGLSTVTVSESFTFFGQAVMLSLIQVGGLGFMTVAVILSSVIRRRITPKERLIAAQSYGLSTNENIRGVVKRIAGRTLLIEGLGAGLLMIRMPKYANGMLHAVWMSVFHSISAFCNAGFDLFSFENGSLSGVKEDYLVLLVLMVLILLGGLGFVVWDDVYDRIVKRKRKLTVYSRFVLIATGVLAVLGTVLTLLTERNNPETLGNLPLFPKIFNALFHSVTLRTAGFATVPNADFTDMGKICSMFFMFVGGCSGSTAGGIKVGTVGVIAMSVISSAFGRKSLVLGKRTIDPYTVQRAVSLFFIGAAIVALFTGIFALYEPQTVVDLAYETMSAFATVGLSAGLTPGLHTVTKILLMVLMFFGRVGILTVTSSLYAGAARSEGLIRYPKTEFYVG